MSEAQLRITHVDAFTNRPLWTCPDFVDTWVKLPMLRDPTAIPERRMPPLPIVEELEILEELGARRRPSGPGHVVDQLDLQRREKALGDGVVPAIALTAHAADDPVVRQHPLVVAAGVLG